MPNDHDILRVYSTVTYLPTHMRGQVFRVDVFLDLCPLYKQHPLLLLWCQKSFDDLPDSCKKGIYQLFVLKLIFINIPNQCTDTNKRHLERNYLISEEMAATRSVQVMHNAVGAMHASEVELIFESKILIG